MKRRRVDKLHGGYPGLAQPMASDSEEDSDHNYEVCVTCQTVAVLPVCCMACSSSFCHACGKSEIQTFQFFLTVPVEYERFGDAYETEYVATHNILPECSQCTESIEKPVTDSDLLDFALSNMGIMRHELVDRYRRIHPAPPLSPSRVRKMHVKLIESFCTTVNNALDESLPISDIRQLILAYSWEWERTGIEQTSVSLDSMRPVTKTKRVG